MKIYNYSNITDAMRLDTKVKEMQLNGLNIINCTAGDPGQSPPINFIKAAHNALDTNIVMSHYGPSQGLTSVRQNLRLWEDIPVAEDYIIISNGAKQLIYMSMRAVAGPGDDVLIIGPCWSSYIEIVKMSGANPIIVLPSNKDYKVTMQDIIKATTSNTVAILFNNPCNPTGIVYNQAFISELISWCDYEELWLISDEIYKNIIFTKEFYSVPARSNTIIINGFSKTYNITGWRFGYAYSNNKKLIEALTSYQSQMSGPPNTLIQIACQTGCQSIPKNYICQLQEMYKNRRDILINELNKYSNFSYAIPDGTFYFYINIGLDSKIFCSTLLENYHIAVTPGDSYGMKNHIRLSYSSVENKNLITVIDSMIKTYKKLTE